MATLYRTSTLRLIFLPADLLHHRHDRLPFAWNGMLLVPAITMRRQNVQPHVSINKVACYRTERTLSSSLRRNAVDGRSRTLPPTSMLFDQSARSLKSLRSRYLRVPPKTDRYAVHSLTLLFRCFRPVNDKINVVVLH